MTPSKKALKVEKDEDYTTKSASLTTQKDDYHWSKYDSKNQIAIIYAQEKFKG
jgi:hypothetical protein